MQYLKHTPDIVRRFAGIGAVFMITLSVGACADMQQHMHDTLYAFDQSFQQRPERAEPVMPGRRLRTYDQGNVTVYPLQGPIPADPGEQTVAQDSRSESRYSHHNPAVTVYDLDNNGALSSYAQTPAGAVEAEQPPQIRTRQQTSKSITGRAPGRFESRARQHAVLPERSSDQEQNKSNLSDYGRGKRSSENTGQNRASGTDALSGASTDETSQQSDTRRMLTAP